jgi:DNA polymerase-1
MPLIRTRVNKRPVKIFALPPETAKFESKWRKFLDSDEIFGYDVETTSTDEALGMFEPSARLRMTQFGTHTEAWCLDPHSKFWRPRIEEVLGSERRFVSHSNYDPLWTLREFGIDLDRRSIDTYPMAALLWPGRTADKDLKALSERWIDNGLIKAQAAMIARFKKLAPTGHRVGKKLTAWGFTNIPLDDPFYSEYGGLDTIYVRVLLDILAKKIKREHMSALSRREQRISQLATKWQWRGLREDTEYTDKLLAEIEAEYFAVDTYLANVFGFSPRSPRRAGWLASRGVEFTEFTDKGNPKLDKETVPELVKRYPVERYPEVGGVLKKMRELSGNQNLLNNLRNIRAAADANDRVHPKVNTQAAHTGRASIVRPAMQTFKKRDKRLRGCFISEDGYVFVGADYDNQETRIAAAFSGDEALRRVVFEGLNQHLLTTELIFDVHDKTTVKDESTGKTYYDTAKILDFAQQYGAGPYKIGLQLGMPPVKCVHRKPGGYLKHPKGDANPEAVRLWESWREAYKGLVDWSDALTKYSHIVNPWGRVIPADKFRRYANGNYAIQSSGRDMLGDAIIKLDEAGYGEQIWLLIHDEIILQVPESDAEHAKTVLEQCMVTQLGDVPITATAEIIGTRWNGEK